MDLYLDVAECDDYLVALIGELDNCESVVITRHGIPVAKLQREESAPIKLGLLEGQFPELNEVDFDAIPTDAAWFKTDPELQRLIDEYYRDNR
jgi:hypothetical protein